MNKEEYIYNLELQLSNPSYSDEFKMGISKALELAKEVPGNDLGSVKLVTKKLREQEDHIIADFIYDASFFSQRYKIPKEAILEIFEFYNDYKWQVDNILNNKVDNVIVRKMKNLWKKIKGEKYGAI